ncbi:MAG: capsular biosynthesis protein [Bryobacterales bacterium]|nr:capsular biosynthesis protein [Bryobacterales bacterium]
MVLSSSAALVAAEDDKARVARLEDEVDGYIRKLTDWAGLVYYGSENAELRPEPGRVVFLGDEITERWKGDGDPDAFFPGKPYVNRGIEGQTTSQLLVRFRQDVIGLQPRVVVIQGGLNDLAGNTGPATEHTIAENIMTMTELAKLHGIRVVLASATPVCDCVPDSPRKDLVRRRPAARLFSLNDWIKEYAATAGVGHVNYFAVLAQGRTMKRELTVDGLVPNAAGYAAMAAAVERAIAEAVKK